MLARLVEATGDVAVAQRWLELDPLHEPAHRALIRLYAERGDRAAALAQYRDCVRTLSRELGVPPLAETTRLYEAISEGTLEAPATTLNQGSTPGGCRVGAPLVGRDREWEALVGAYDGIDADGRVVLLEGEAGIGKTRLAEELVAHARGRGAAVLGGRAYEEEAALAYGPLVDALRGRLRDDDAWLAAVSDRALCEAARLLPDLSAPLPRRSTAPPRRRASSTACGRRCRPPRRGRCPACSSSTTCSGRTRPRSGCSATAPAGWAAAGCSCC